MGVLFSKKKTSIKESTITYEKKPTIKEIIKHYEFIKQTKNIHNIETILEIVENTDWDKIDLDYTPSAPPIPSDQSIPIAIPIK